MGFKEHGLILYLSPELQICQIKLQADKGLGRSYAGLLAYIEGMHTFGYLQGEAYENLKRRYSRGLLEEEPKPLTLADINAKKELDKWAKNFSMVLEQWKDHLDPAWRQGWIRKAERWKDKVENANYVLALKNGESEE